jgi:hypothetical protein
VRRALLALAAVVVIGTGVVALTTSVPVLTVSGGKNGFVGRLSDGQQVLYSYRQSMYEVMVWEEFVREGDRLRLLSVEAEDIRAIEYFRWDTPIRPQRDHFIADAPPTEVKELVIRVAPGAEQRIRSVRWSIFLEERFGDAVITVKLERTPVLLALVQGLVW